MNGCWSLVPEPDQQVGREADRLPAKVQLQEIVRHNQHQHGERKQGDITEEALITRVVAHVTDGVDVDQQRHEADDRHHERRQAVDQEADMHFNAVTDHPGVYVPVIRFRAVDQHQLEHVRR